MRIAVAALILVFLLSTAICKGEENRDQEAEEDPATENFYLELLQVLENFYLELLQFFGTLVLCWDGLYGSNAIVRRMAVWDSEKISRLTTMRLDQSKVFASFKIWANHWCIFENYLCQL